MTELQIRGLLGLIAGNYRQFEVNPPLIHLWASMLADVEPEAGLKAVYAHIKASKWPPSIAEILEAVRQVTGEADNNGSGDAWGTCLAAIRRFGSYRGEEALEWMPERVAATVRRMGWKELCASDNAEADRAHFMRIYEQVAKREETERIYAIEDREVEKLVLHLAEKKSFPPQFLTKEQAAALPARTYPHSVWKEG